MPSPTPPGFVEGVERIAATLQRDINILVESSTTRSQKKSSLDKIKLDVSKLDSSLVPSLFELYLLKPLLKCWHDPVEKIRELASCLVLDYCNLSTEISPCLNFITPSLSARLSSIEMVEPAEEVRLTLLRIANSITQSANEKIYPFCDDLVSLLRRTLNDPYPEVKKESCKLVIHLATFCPKALKYYGPEITTMLTSSLLYRHASVRTIALTALKQTIHVDLTGLDDCLKHIYTTSRDKSTSVRQQTYETVYWWLIHLDDRYSVANKLLPILLSGLADDMSTLQSTCQSYMNAIGELYEREWIDRCKAQLDFVPLAGQDSSKPRIGTQNYLKENTMKIVERVCLMFESWTSEERIQGARILVSLIQHVGENITGYTTSLLVSFVKMCSTDEATVLQQVVLCANCVGRYVDPTVYFESMLKNIKLSAQNSIQHRNGCLLVLEALLSGSLASVIARYDETASSRTLVSEVMECLMSGEIIGNENLSILLHVSKIIKTLCRKVLESSGTVGKEGYDIFTALLLLKCVTGNEQMSGWVDLKKQCSESLDILTKAYNFETTSMLYEHHLETHLNMFQNTHFVWNQYSWQVQVFKRVMTNCSITSLESHFSIIFDILKQSSTTDKEYQVRSTVLEILHYMLNQTLEYKQIHVRTIVGEVLLPNLVWKGGPKAAKLRSSAMICMKLVFSQDVHLTYIAGEGVQLLVTCLMGNIDDDTVETRMSCLEVVERLFAHPLLVLNGAQLRVIYPELLKRMDDAQNNVRVLASSLFASFYEYVEKYGLQDGDERFDDGMLKHQLESFILHMDDQDLAVQNSVFNAMKRISSLKCLSKQVLVEVLEDAQKTHRNLSLLEQLKAMKV